MRGRLTSQSGVTRRAVVLAAVVVAVIALVSSPARGRPSSDDKARVDQQLAQAEATLETATARAQQAGVAFTVANRQLPAARLAVDEARGRVAAAQVKADEARRSAEGMKRQLVAAEATLAKNQQAVEQARDALGDFVASTYEGQPYMAASSLLAGGGPDAMLARLGYVDNIAGRQKRALNTVTKARLIAAEKRAQVAEKKRQADVADAQARRALADADAEEQAAEAAQARVTRLVGQRQQALNIAQQEKIASNAQYDQLLAESERIAAELREAAREEREAQQRAAAAAAAKARSNSRQGSTRSRSPSSNNRPRSSQPSASSRGFIKPVDGWKSSDFGWRYDPFYHRWQLHAGTDFAAPRGTPIWAAASGRVIRAGWNGGYGNYTCIYHGLLPNGRGLSTCYGHQSAIQVRVGQHVRQGQVIGRVGTTGASTGNHLHFEVRLDGEPVNPLPWL